MKGILRAALAAILAAGAATAHAELSLESAAWQQGAPSKPPRPPVWSDAAKATVGKGKLRLRGKAVLKNRGPKAAEGILMRYTIAARLVPDRAVAAEAAWSLPFVVDERRVPKIGPNQVVEIPLTVSPALDHYLKKTARQGFRANALKISAMLETHASGGVLVQEGLLELVP